MFLLDTCNAVPAYEDREPKYWRLGRRHLLYLALVSRDLVFRDLVSLDLISRNFVSKDLISRNLISKDLASKDLVSLDLVSKDLVSKDLVSKDLVSKDLVSRDLVSRDLVFLDLVFRIVAVHQPFIFRFACILTLLMSTQFKHCIIITWSRGRCILASWRRRWTTTLRRWRDHWWMKTSWSWTSFDVWCRSSKRITCTSTTTSWRCTSFKAKPSY